MRDHRREISGHGYDLLRSDTRRRSFAGRKNPPRYGGEILEFPFSYFKKCEVKKDGKGKKAEGKREEEDGEEHERLEVRHKSLLLVKRFMT